MAKTYIYIDGQNVGPNVLPNLNKKLSELGIKGGVKRYYHSRNDDARLGDDKRSKLDENEVEIISVNCKAAKNSVDIRIAVDSIETSCTDTQSEKFIFVTNDSDFSHVTSRIINFGKDVFLLYTKKGDHSSYSASVKKQHIGATPSTTRSGAIVQRATQAVKAAVPPKILATAKQTANIITGRPKEAGHYDSFDRNRLIQGFEKTGGIIIPSDKMYRSFKEIYDIEWNRGVPKIEPQVFADLFFGKNIYRFVRLKVNDENSDGFYINNIISRTAKIPRKPRELIACFGCTAEGLFEAANNISQYIENSDFEYFKGGPFQNFVRQMPAPRHIGFAFTNLIYEELGRPEAGSTRNQMLKYNPKKMYKLFRDKYRELLDNQELILKMENPKTANEEGLKERIDKFLDFVKI